MFAYIKGTLEELGEDYIVVDCSNIGFMIMTSKNVIASVKTGEVVKVYTHLNVREDDMSLYGFINKEELNLFKLLINVNGIGPKGALSILSTLTVYDLKMAILSEDFKLISKANGIGAKTAQRVVIELKDKIKLDDISSGFSSDDLSVDVNNDTITEVASALISLGYSNTEAAKAINKVSDKESLTVEQLLREALKKMI